MKQYTDALGVLQKKFWEDVSELGDRIREEVIIPICKKHKLGYLAGMGRFYFYSGEKTYGADYDHMSAALRKDLLPIFELLNTEVADNQVLGYYIDDVRPEKERKS